MGIYDREYYREDEPQGLLSGRSMVVNLIILNGLIFLADSLFFSERGPMDNKVGAISTALALKANLLAAPWNCWQLITYGFVHTPGSIGHVVFNMLFLWFFGVDVESVYGRKEFVRIYLTLIVMSGLAWVIVHDVAVGSIDSQGTLIGASGAVLGIAVLYVLHFPRRIINFWGVFPVQAWVVVSLFIAGDLLSFLQLKTGNPMTAYSAHIAGAACAFVYFRSGWNLGRLVPSRLSLSALKLKPKLRIHDPESDERELSRQVDRILEKIHRDGEASLTKKERKTLEEASRRYQRKRQ